MNWKLVLQLSLFGLVMGPATVYVVPSSIEPFCWLGIFLVCAYVIATKAPGRYFVHGLMVSLVNGVWMTASHVLLAERYMAGHAQEAAMMTSMPLPTHPRIMMLVIGPIAGVVSGIVLGVFSVVAGKLTASRRSPARQTPRA